MPNLTSTNGHVRNSEILRLGDTTPKQFPIEFEYNGQLRQLKGWDIRSRRYPSSVAAELDDARNDFIAAQRRVNAEGQPVNPILLAATRAIVDECKDQNLAEVVTDGRMQALIDELRNAVGEVESSSVRTSQRAWERYVTRCLQAVVDGIDHDEADMLGPDRMRVLVRAGLFPESMLPVEDALEIPDGDAAETAQGAGAAQNPPQQETETSTAHTTGEKPEHASLGRTR